MFQQRAHHMTRKESITPLHYEDNRVSAPFLEDTLNGEITLLGVSVANNLQFLNMIETICDIRIAAVPRSSAFISPMSPPAATRPPADRPRADSSESGPRHR
jgi:hypothetical protein